MNPLLDLLPDGAWDWIVRHAEERRFAPGDAARLLPAQPGAGRTVIEAGMNRPFEARAFRGPCTRIAFQPEGIDLFAECVRQP